MPHFCYVFIPKTQPNSLPIHGKLIEIRKIDRAV